MSSLASVSVGKRDFKSACGVCVRWESGILNRLAVFVFGGKAGF